MWVLGLCNKSEDAVLLRFEEMERLSSGALGKVKLPFDSVFLGWLFIL